METLDSAPAPLDRQQQPDPYLVSESQIRSSPGSPRGIVGAFGPATVQLLEHRLLQLEGQVMRMGENPPSNELLGRNPVKVPQRVTLHRVGGKFSASDGRNEGVEAQRSAITQRHSLRLSLFDRALGARESHRYLKRGDGGHVNWSQTRGQPSKKPLHYTIPPSSTEAYSSDLQIPASITQAGGRHSAAASTAAKPFPLDATIPGGLKRSAPHKLPRHAEAWDLAPPPVALPMVSGSTLPCARSTCMPHAGLQPSHGAKSQGLGAGIVKLPVVGGRVAAVDFARGRDRREEIVAAVPADSCISPVGDCESQQWPMMDAQRLAGEINSVHTFESHSNLLSDFAMNLGAQGVFKLLRASS